MTYLSILPILIAEFFVITLFSAAPIGTAAVVWSLTVMFYAFSVEKLKQIYLGG